MRLFAIVLSLIGSLVMFGCSSSSQYMYNAQDVGLRIDQTILPQESAVIFYRADMVGYPDLASVTDNLQTPKIIAQLNSKAKFIYKTQPGIHFFGVYYDDIANVIKADLKPGQYYYLKVSPSLDGIKPRFVFDDPKSQSLQQIEKDLQDAVWFEPKRNLDSLNVQHAEFIKRQVQKGYIEWQESGKPEVARTFNLTEPL